MEPGNCSCSVMGSVSGDARFVGVDHKKDNYYYDCDYILLDHDKNKSLIWIQRVK